MPRTRDEVQNWYFTFGVGQQHAGHYVVIRDTYENARKKMFAKFDREWAFQYSEQAWFDWVKSCKDRGLDHWLETELILDE